MKKVLALMLALALILTGCESNPNQISKFSRNNWQAVISENFGINIPEPEGWAIESVDNNRTNKVDINFVLDGEESYHSFGEKIFSAAKDASIEKPALGFDTSIKLDTYEDAAQFSGVVFFEYYMDGYHVELYYYDNGGEAELVLNKLTD